MHVLIAQHMHRLHSWDWRREVEFDRLSGMFIVCATSHACAINTRTDCTRWGREVELDRLAATVHTEYDANHPDSLVICGLWTAGVLRIHTSQQRMSLACLAPTRLILPQCTSGIIGLNEYYPFMITCVGCETSGVHINNSLQ